MVKTTDHISKNDVITVICLSPKIAMKELLNNNLKLLLLTSGTLSSKGVLEKILGINKKNSLSKIKKELYEKINISIDLLKYDVDY